MPARRGSVLRGW